MYDNGAQYKVPSHMTGTESVLSVCGCVAYSLLTILTAANYHYTVSQKNILDIFSCNSRKHCRIFIMFGTHVAEKVSNQ